MDPQFWVGTVIGALLGVLGSLAAFRAPLAVLTQIAKDHNVRLTSVEKDRDRILHAAGMLRTRKTDTPTEGD